MNPTDNEDLPPKPKPTLLITIPLSDYAEALIGFKEYSVIDDRVRGYFTATGAYSELVVIENDGETENFKCESLPKLKDGLWRLWQKSYFEKIEAGRKTRLVRATKERSTRQQMEHGVAQGLWELMGRKVGIDLCLSSARRMDMVTLGENCRKFGVKLDETIVNA